MLFAPQTTQSVHTEVVKIGREVLIKGPKGSIRDQDLPTVCGIGDARCAVHHAADIIHSTGGGVGFTTRSPDMDTHPHPQAAKDSLSLFIEDLGA